MNPSRIGFNVKFFRDAFPSIILNTKSRHSVVMGIYHLIQRHAAIQKEMDRAERLLEKVKETGP